MIGIVGTTLGTLSGSEGGGPAGGVVGSGGVVEGERVADALAESGREPSEREADRANGTTADPVPPVGAEAATAEPDVTDRLELGVALLPVEVVLLRIAEVPEALDDCLAAGLSLRGEEREPRGSSRSPPIASGAKVRSARGTIASDRADRAAAPPPEVSRSSAGNDSSPTIAPGSATAPSSRIVPRESLSRASASELDQVSVATSGSVGASSRSGRPEKASASTEGRSDSAACLAHGSSIVPVVGIPVSSSGRFECSAIPATCATSGA